jgi:hypothetical protein
MTTSRREDESARLRRRARAMTSLALKTLKEIMQGDGQAAVKLAAAREILDRGHGRPKLGELQEGPEGLTVVVRRFTDAPDPEAGKFEEVDA